MRRLVPLLTCLALALPGYGAEYVSSYDPRFVRRVASLVASPLHIPIMADVACSSAFTSCGFIVGFGSGGTGLTAAADDTTIVSSGTAWVAKALPNCVDSGGNHLNYTAATNAFSCGTSSAAAGADTALSNLAAVAINTALLPDAAAADDFGSATLPFKDLFFAGSSGTPGTNNFRITGASTSGTRVITLPNATATLAQLGAQTFSGLQTLGAGAQITAAAGLLLLEDVPIYLRQTVDGKIYIGSVQTNRALQFGTPPTSNSILISETADTAFNFAHAVSTTPIVHFHSQNQSTTEYGSIGHDATDFRLFSGAGSINLAPAGHVKMTGTAPAVTANCGTSPTVTGSDMAGKLDVGTGGTATTCTLTFAVAYTVAPACVGNDETSVRFIQAVSTTTTLILNSINPTLGTAQAFGASDKISYICIQGS